MIKVAEDKETTPAEATLTTWSFGRRLQSASVSSFPSRNLRVDSPSSASSGSGLIRYSSSLARALFRLASKAKTHRKLYHRILKDDKPNYRHIGCCMLTSIFIRFCVFDKSWKSGKYVISCCVGFMILCCKFGVPEKTAEHCFGLLPGLFTNLFLSVCETYFGGASFPSRNSSILLTSE